MKMLYTANGRYIRCCTEEGTRPVIIVCEKEYEVDHQFADTRLTLHNLRNKSALQSCADDFILYRTENARACQARAL